MHKLTFEQATSIRNLHLHKNVSVDVLAKKYGIGKQSVLDVLANRSHHDRNYNPRQIGLAQVKLTNLVQEILSLREDGKTYTTIGVELAKKYDRRKGRRWKAWTASAVRDAINRGESK